MPPSMHGTTGVGTLLACARALLTVLMGVLGTLGGASLTDSRAQFAYGIGLGAASRHQPHGGPADISAIEIQPNAGAQCQSVLFGQAGGGAVQARHVTRGAFIDAGLEVLVRHLGSP